MHVPVECRINKYVFCTFPFTFEDKTYNGCMKSEDDEGNESYVCLSSKRDLAHDYNFICFYILLEFE